MTALESPQSTATITMIPNKALDMKCDEMKQWKEMSLITINNIPLWVGERREKWSLRKRHSKWISSFLALL